MGEDGYFDAIKTIRLDLLELFGRGYVIDHCIAAFHQKNEEKLYRVYLTDALKAVVGNTATHYEQEVSLSKRWIDVVDATPPPKEDTRPAKEVARDMWKRIRGE